MLKSETDQSNPVRRKRLATKPADCLSGNPNSTFMVKLVWAAASPKRSRRSRLPLGGGVQTISGPNQTVSDPRCCSASLQDGRFMVLYFTGVQLLILPATMLDSRHESPAHICSTKPQAYQTDSGTAWVFRSCSSRDERQRRRGRVLVGEEPAGTDRLIIKVDGRKSASEGLGRFGAGGLQPRQSIRYIRPFPLRFFS